jgi:Lsr2
MIGTVAGETLIEMSRSGWRRRARHCRVGAQGFSRESREGYIATMAQSVTVMLVDDLDQSDAAQTVHFGVDGAAYEIDLSARHASELRSVLGRYISAARRIRQAPVRAWRQRRPRPRTVMDREQSRRIRSWAMDRGLLASPRGRIPQHVADKYQAAMRVSAAPVRSPGAAGAVPASRGSGTRPASGRRARRGAAEGGKTAVKADGEPTARVARAGSSGAGRARAARAPRDRGYGQARPEPRRWRAPQARPRRPGLSRQLAAH